MEVMYFITLGALIAVVVALTLLLGKAHGERDTLAQHNGYLRMEKARSDEEVKRYQSIIDAERKMREDAEDSLSLTETLADRLADASNVLITQEQQRQEALARRRSKSKGEEEQDDEG